jgi:hypothetical protein
MVIVYLFIKRSDLPPTKKRFGSSCAFVRKDDLRADYFCLIVFVKDKNISHLVDSGFEIRSASSGIVPYAFARSW